MSEPEHPPPPPRSPPPPPPVFETFDDGYDPDPMPPVRSNNRLVLWIVLGVVVLFLIGAGVAAMFLFRIKEFVPDVQELGARAQMATVAMAVDEYERKEGELPASLAELREARKDDGRRYLGHMPRDPWGGQFQYRLLNEGRSYELRSVGPDGDLGTDDDVVYTTD